MTRPPAATDDLAFFDDAPCGFVATSADGVIRRVNQTFVAMCGIPAHGLVGERRLPTLLSKGDQIYVETHVAPLLLGAGQVQEIALELVTAEGARVPVLMNATLVRDDDDVPTGVRYAIFDATERRAYERELLAARARAEESEARARRLVRGLQEALLPPVVPVIEGLELAAAYRPAGDGDEVGGDFYDVFQVGSDDWIAVIGDVTGKGVEAATVTALARYTVRATAVRTAEPRAILSTLNDVLRHDDTTTRWCTSAISHLSREGEAWTVRTCHAGHPLGLLVPAAGQISELGEPGTVLGAMEQPTLHTACCRLDPGDGVVFYTDGVTDARSPHGFYGESALRATLTRHRGSAHGLVYGLLDDVVAFQADRTADDIVILGLQVPT